MHRFLAIVLVLLIPVRVFGAESVGLCMLQAGVAHGEAMVSMPDDCLMTAHVDTPQHPGSGCDSCELCMPLAGPDDVVVAQVSRPESVAPIASLAHFASAEVDRALRPPIS